MYEILDWLEKERRQFIKLFWGCVFQNHILQNYPSFRSLQGSLLESQSLDLFSTPFCVDINIVRVLLLFGWIYYHSECYLKAHSLSRLKESARRQRNPADLSITERKRWRSRRWARQAERKALVRQRNQDLFLGPARAVRTTPSESLWLSDALNSSRLGFQKYWYPFIIIIKKSTFNLKTNRSIIKK